MRTTNKEYSKHKWFFKNFHNHKFVQFCDFFNDFFYFFVEIVFNENWVFKR